ncbi:MAG: PAS domain-containing protein, partial [Planctomycetes bacterium]|nr:PAS domain-containing protein [Planctomycetota bacterium]
MVDENGQEECARLRRQVAQLAAENAVLKTAHAQRVSHEEQHRLQSILDFAPALISIKDIDGTIILVNRNFENLQGPKPEEFIGSTVYDLFPFEIADALWKNDLLVHETGHAMEAEEVVRHKDGTDHTYLTVKFPLRDTQNTLIGTCAISTDISDRKVKENLLFDSVSQMRTTLDSIADGVVSIDLQGNIQNINKHALTLCRGTSSDVIGKPLFAVFNIVDPSSMERIALPIAVGNECPESTSRGLGMLIDESEDGSSLQLWLEYACSQIKDDQDKVLGTVLILSDVTREKHLEEQLRQSQKMEAIGQLAGGIAHDFNNMLGGIIGAAELLSMGTQQINDHETCIDLIMKTATRAAELTGKLLSFSRKGKMVNTKVDMHAIIADTIDILQRSIDKRIIIRDDLSADRPDVFGDPAQLFNVILNLGLNARDAMGDATGEVGVISVSTENIEIDGIFCDKSEFDIHAGHYLLISVRDSGVGISPEERGHIFEPFFTTKDPGKGTGLGLAAVYGSMCDHDGAVTVYSELGQGSVFNIYLPTSDAPDTEIHVMNQDLGNLSNNTCVLVIDDEEIIRQTAQAILEANGCEVLLARNGVEAIRPRSHWLRELPVP